MECRQAWPDVVVEVRLVEAGPQAIGIIDLPPRQLRLDVDVRADDPERIEVRAIECRHASEHAEHGESRDSEAVGPAAPDPGLVDQRLADVEGDALDCGDSLHDG